MSDTTPTTDDYDSPWKDMLAHAWPEFMAFYFPEAHAQIDWSRGYSFLDTELRQVVRDAELGKRFADVLVQVSLLDGAEQWIYVHVEIQGWRDSDFAQRMFVYNYRLYDRYERPVASFAVLADEKPGWKPASFGFEVLGCSHQLQFPVVKLLEFGASELESTNPFAIVTAAHRRNQQTRHDPEARFNAKLGLVRQLYRHGWERQRVLDLFAVLDWMMRLPDGLERKLWSEIGQIEEERRVRYVTSVERFAIERGMQQGMQQGMQKGMQQGLERGRQLGETLLLERLLVKRFGSLPDELRGRLESATVEQLEGWAERLLDARSLADVFRD